MQKKFQFCFYKTDIRRVLYLHFFSLGQNEVILSLVKTEIILLICN